MNYRIISNPDRLKSFIDWLPDLEVNERFYGCLFARKKYCPDLVQSSDKTQLKRFVSKKEDLFYKIKQLECPIGSYRLKDREVPQESLVLYLNPNPRDLIKASFASIKALTDCIQNKSQGFNPHAEVISCIQKSTSRKIYFDVDFDLPDGDEVGEIIGQIKQILPNDCLTFVRTRGGIHCLIRLAQIGSDKKKTWYNEIMRLPGVDRSSDQLLPVPGCVQGGFEPYFVEM